MHSNRNEDLDRTVLVGLLGPSQMRASDLARESRAIGHYVPKKFVRRRLTADGVTGIEGVNVTEKPRRRFWFSAAHEGTSTALS